MCTLRADSGLRAKPCPIRTCSRFHIVQTAFRRRTIKGGDLFREHGLTVFQLELFQREHNSLEPVQTTRNCVYREHVPRTCSRWNCTENKCERPVFGTECLHYLVTRAVLHLFEDHPQLHCVTYNIPFILGQKYLNRNVHRKDMLQLEAG